MRARYYDSELGRFISRDPIGMADDVNLYSYVGNSPVMKVDLLGLWGENIGVIAWDKTVSLSKKVRGMPRFRGTVRATLGAAQAAAGGAMMVAGGGACFAGGVFTAGTSCAVGAVGAAYGGLQVAEGGAAFADGLKQIWSLEEATQFYDAVTRYNPIDYALGIFKAPCEVKIVVNIGMDVFINKKLNSLGKIPQGLTKEQFSAISKSIRSKIGNISSNISVHGSRANYTAKLGSDLDIAVRVSKSKFMKLLEKSYPIINSQARKEISHAIDVGKINTRPSGLVGLREEVSKLLGGMDVDISIIEKGGKFDKGPFIDLFK